VKDVVIARQGPGIQGDGYVATIYFNILKSGKSRIDFEEVIIANQQGTKLPVSLQGIDVRT
jgi:hypothetical protein